MGWEEMVQLYEAAKAKLSSNKKEQAIGLFRQALKNKPIYPKSTQQEWNDFYSIKIELGGMLRDEGDNKKQKGQLSDCKQLIESRSIFVEVIKDFKEEEINDKLSQQSKRQLQYSVFQNYAKLLIIFAEDDIERERYSRYRQQMNQSYKYFRQSQQIVIQKIKEQIASSGYISKKEWIERYLRQISNLMSLIMLEGQVFMDQECLDHVLVVTDHSKLFYDLNKSHKIQTSLETHLHRCQYYKASALLLKNRFKEALELFKQVYKFEKGNNQLQDAQKSRSQILRILMSLNNIKQAYGYANTKDAKEIIGIIKQRRDRIHKAFTAHHSQIKKYTYQFILELFSDFDEDCNQYYYDYEEMDKLISQSIFLFAQKKKQRAELYYYLCEANLKMRKFKRALEMILQALKIGSSQNFTLRDWKIEEIKARIGLNPNDKVIDDRIKALRQQLKSEALRSQNKLFYKEFQDQNKALNKIEVQLTKARRKAQDKVSYKIISSSDQELIRKLESMANDKERQKSKVSLSKYQISSESTPRACLNFEEPPKDQKNQQFNLSHLKQKQKLQVDNPEQYYKQQCKEYKIAERPQIITLFNQSLQFNPYSEILNMARQQLQILLPLVKVQNLDLRNHCINDVLLQIILNKTNLGLVKMFKVNGINHVSHEMLLTIISKMSHVQCLSFVEFSVQKPKESIGQNSNSYIQNMEHPRSIVHVLGLLPKTVSTFRCQQLKVLKLKFCGLMDQHIVQMGIERYEFLQEISLSHNLLRGKYFQRFMMLKDIAKVNVSDNPLETFSFSMWKDRYLEQGFCLKALKLRSISLQPSLIEDLTKVLLRVVQVNFSSSQKLPTLIDELMLTNIREGRSIFNLQKIVMKNIDLSTINIYNLMQMSKGLQVLDLRGCRYSYQTKRKILQQKQENLDLKISGSEQESGWLQGFALGKGGVDCQRV